MFAPSRGSSASDWIAVPGKGTGLHVAPLSLVLRVTPLFRTAYTWLGFRASTASCWTTPAAESTTVQLLLPSTVLYIAPGLTPAAVAAYRTCGWSGSIVSACI